MKTNKGYSYYTMYIFISLALVMGIIIGMMFQQMLFTASAVEIGNSLEGSTFNIQVDFNETKLVEEFRDKIVPVLNESINEAKQ